MKDGIHPQLTQKGISEALSNLYEEGIKRLQRGENGICIHEVNENGTLGEKVDI